jgi:chromosome transmission fidelity protein 1
LALQILSQPTDIEEVAGFAAAGEMNSSSSLACGYYASRLAVATAQVIVLSYSMLLNPNTRQSVGLHDLSRSFVIVDEAHNLPETIRNLQACKLSSETIERALQQLHHYVTKYAHRLAGRNLFYLGQIRRILLAFQKHLKSKPSAGSSNRHHRSRPPPPPKSSIMQTATELLIELKLDNINIFRLLRYLNRSKLSQKLLGFTKFINQQEKSDESPDQVKLQSNDHPEEFISKHVSAMSIVEAFLEKLTLSEKEGKIVTDWPGNDENPDPSAHSSNVRYPTLRYVLLHPAACFENVVKEAHAVALVGGTLRPFAHMAAELLFLGDRRGSSSSSRWLYEAAKADEFLQATTHRFVSEEDNQSASYVAPNFTAFTCDHVVPASNVLLQCLARGPTGTLLDFRFQSRSSVRVMDELGRTLIRIGQTVPGGVVVFLPSYSYEAQLVRHWKSSDIWQELMTIKQVHREPKSSQNVESALQAFARDAAAAASGAMLLSIVGGKMSEGINFADDMARCVCCVGLPYPDITDPELVEKMASLDAVSASSKATNNDNDAGKAMITGKAYYQNLCMRAVNQSVGRAIRHANDYAAVVLMDQRYTTDHRIWAGLPNWLKKSDGTTRWREDWDLDQRLHEMEQFFRGKASSSK